MQTKYKLCLDLDGVISDFQSRVEELLKGPIDPNKKGSVWAAVQNYDNEIGPFFENLEKMEDADILIKFIRENFAEWKILTASGTTPKDGPAQKIRWCSRHIGEDIECVVVPKSPDKAAHACPLTILVDDRAKSIDPFIKMGGIGVLHVSAEDTIEQLKDILAKG